MQRIALTTALICLWLCSVTAAPMSKKLRRPVALAQSPDQSWLYTANRDSGSISIIDLDRNALAGEVVVGGQLSDVVAWSDQHLLALDQQHHQLVTVKTTGPELRIVGRLDVPHYPVRVIADRKSNRCFVSSLWSRSVAQIDLTEENGLRASLGNRLLLPFEPREMCLAGDTLVVAGSFHAELASVETSAELRLGSTRRIPGHNIRGIAVTDDGSRILLAQQELNPLAQSTKDDVHWGNMVSNRLVSIKLDDLLNTASNLNNHRVTYDLGEPGNAAGDPGRIAVGHAGKIMVALSGVNELATGSIDKASISFIRKPVGNRPSAVEMLADGRAAVANMFADSVSIIATEESESPPTTITLGEMRELSPVEQGEMLFFDCQLSHDGWMSCHSCHTDGHSNGQLNDNLSDGGFGDPKRVISLLGVAATEPWAWNGTIPTLDQQIANSIMHTMQGGPVDNQQVAAIVAYLRTLVPPPSLMGKNNQGNAPNIERGGALFESLECGKCHTPPTFTSEKTYEVGLSDTAGYSQFNPPSLRGVGRRSSLFHDGRAASLEAVFRKYQHQLSARLADEDLSSLVDYLRSI